ncbi:hypothetical protein [Lentilactobacillus sp. Marseille-Q4993]|nr:hypothetical protein [Lentilactobacillus sp. Marseille-Q4993]
MDNKDDNHSTFWKWFIIIGWISVILHLLKFIIPQILWWMV